MAIELIVPIIGIILAFTAGYLLAEKAANDRERAVERALAKQRLELGWSVPPYTYTTFTDDQPQEFKADRQFEDTLRTNGQATVMLKKEQK